MYLDRLKKHGPTLRCVITLTDQLALQQAMFERELTPFQEQLLRYLPKISNSPKKVREFIALYADGVERTPAAGQGAMFGLMGPKKEDILGNIERAQAEPELPIFIRSEPTGARPEPAHAADACR